MYEGKEWEQCAVCGSTHLVHLHHIVPVRSGGKHDKDNLIPLCPRHHEEVHKGMIDPREYKKDCKKES